MTVSIDCLGIGLRTPHYKDLLEKRPHLSLIEFHSENHFYSNGHSRTILHKAKEIAPISLHGVGLSLGSADGLDNSHLKKLVNLVDDINPSLISEHISWGRIGNIHTHDLLPLPYCKDVIQLVADNIDHVQQALGREIIVENVSSYVSFEQSNMKEWDFVYEILEKADCGFLLDINNVFVNSQNFNFNIEDYLKSLPWDRVKEVHVAGHQAEENLLVDTHDRPACSEVKSWLDKVYSQCINKPPVLLEWDSSLPSFEKLIAHMHDLATEPGIENYALA
ncbi:MAG: DUF692 domain-containing protein [Ketobacter sp.]|uniref:MNIO family bufferin maturase n=1 Tax=Ketobacter sp. MCCC 1A13808 TaxID=2602738 RepID=UPI0018DB886E|nr:DUF692 domain-containing protein [Ketobacter sp. MCCC 1A13808]